MIETKISHELQSRGVTHIDNTLNGALKTLEDRDHVDEDEYQCKYCTDLCYLSMATCTVHCSHSQEVDDAVSDEDQAAAQSLQDKQQPVSKYEQRKKKL